MPLFRDPWAEDAARQSMKAVATLHVARRDLERFADRLPSLKAPITDFAQALGDVEAAYRADPAIYRATRALPVVHVPALLRILSALAERADTGLASDTTRAVRAQLDACLEEARSAIAAAREKGDLALDIEMETLSTAVVPAAQVRSPGAWSRVRQHTDRIAGDVGKVLAGTGAELSRRAGATGEVAASYIGGAIGDGLGTIADPIAARLKAAGRVAQDATLEAAMSAGLWAILFPPLVPASVFLSLMASTSQYDSALDRARADLEKDRQSRAEARRQSRELAIARALGRSAPVLRHETDGLHMTIDVETRDTDGIVLRGRHAGCRLTDLTQTDIAELRRHAPDRETADLLRSWQAHQA